MELVLNKCNIKFAGMFSTILSAAIPTVIILQYSNLLLFNIQAIIDCKIWLIIILTVTITSLIVTASDVIGFTMTGHFMECVAGTEIRKNGLIES